jgi:hypothetical protein
MKSDKSLTISPPLTEMAQPHRMQMSILEEFLHDPKTKNLYSCDPGRQHVHVAVIVKRGKVLAEAYNRNGGRSNGSGYSHHSIHAEKNVVKQLGDISQLRDADLYVMRVAPDRLNTGKHLFRNSKPCNDCRLFLEKCMREYGLKNVYYTS